MLTKENRSRTVSVFNGPLPIIRVLKSQSEEIASVAQWIFECAEDGVAPHEFGAFVRSEAELERKSRWVLGDFWSNIS